MGKKRNLTDIVRTAGVGVISTIGGINIIKTAIDIGDIITPHIERYVGLIGSDVAKYALPVVAGVGAASAIYTAIKATDKYLLEQEDKK